MSASRIPKAFTIWTLKRPAGSDPKRKLRLSECEHVRVAEVWAGTASDAIAAVRAQHPELRGVMLVSSAPHLDDRKKVLTQVAN
jgi:hypothetical protein